MPCIIDRSLPHRRAECSEGADPALFAARRWGHCHRSDPAVISASGGRENGAVALIAQAERQ